MTKNKKYVIIPSAFHARNEANGIAEVIRYETMSSYDTEAEAVAALPAHDCDCGGYRICRRQIK